MSTPPGPWRFKLAATVIPAVPPPTIKTLWCVVPAIMALPSNWPARCGLGHSLAKHRIIILNPMSIAVQHAHEGRRFFALAPPPRQNVACEGVGLIRLCFREMLCRGLASWSDFVSGGTESSRTEINSLFRDYFLPMAPLGRPQVEWAAALGGIRWLMQKLWLCARNWRAARARMITANGAARSMRAACNTAWGRMSK